MAAKNQALRILVGLAGLSGFGVIVAEILKKWHFVNFSGNTLEITKGGSGFEASYLDDPERLDKFKGLCRDFFRHEVAVKISGRKEKRRTMAFPIFRICWCSVDNC